MNWLVLVLAVVILVIALQKRLHLIVSRFLYTLYEFEFSPFSCTEQKYWCYNFSKNLFKYFLKLK